MVLGNYIKLEADKPKLLRFSRLYIAEREIRDPFTNQVKKVRVLEGRVIQEDGVTVDKIFSITAEKLAVQLERFIDDREINKYLFTIVKRGTGYLTEYEVQVK
ncbi:MAG: hypothetical protein QXW26_04680 [Candidatus Nitrosocaldus sp.]